MDQNSSSEELAGMISDPTVRRVKLAVVQVLVWFFFCIDISMLFTFFSKQTLRGETRYILFAHTLLMDSIYLLFTNLVFLLAAFNMLLPTGSCILFCFVMDFVSNCTPLTITAMCLERYVAICMPLRHADISTTGRTLVVIAIISVYSTLNPFVDLFILIVTAPSGYFAKPNFCFCQVMILTEWHQVMWAAWSQMDLIVILIIILFCYVKIMLAAQTASGENKQSASKGTRTLLLHGLQLSLCMVDLVRPYIESIVQEYNMQIYPHIRYTNFVLFGIISRALSSMIYGIRDEKFFLALMYYATCRFNYNVAA